MDDSVYQIKQWNGVFEDHNTRRYQSLTYVGIPVNRQSETFSLLMETREGVIAYGVFTGPLLRISAGCPVRGVLLDERGPYTADRVARRFNMPKKVVQAAWDLLASPAVGWLEEAPPDAIQSARERAHERARGTAPHRESDDASTRGNPTNQPTKTPTNTTNQPTNQPADGSVGRDAEAVIPSGELAKRAYAVLIDFGVNETTAWELASGGVKPSRVNKLLPTMKNAKNPPAALVDRLRKELARV